MSPMCPEQTPRARPHQRFTEDGRRIREVLSYSRRGGRFTPSQREAWVAHSEAWVIPEQAVDAPDFRLADWFGRAAPLIVEVGSGVGEATGALAAARPSYDVLALEVWRPGIAASLAEVAAAGATHVRFCSVDAVWTLEHLVAPGALAELWTLLALLVGIVNWFIALVRGRTPASVHAWFERYLRYTTHVGAYALLLADPYPRFRGWRGTYPVDLRVGPPVAQPRWKIAVRIVLALPALVFAYVLGIVSAVVAILSWFAAVTTARVPLGFQRLGAYCLRYQVQTLAYLLLVTDKYPTLANEFS